MNKAKALSQLREINKTLEHLESASSIIQWEMRTGAPKKSFASHSEALAYFAGEIHKLKTSDWLEEAINTLESAGSLTVIDAAMLRETKKEYLKNKSIPTTRKKAYSKIFSQAEGAWMQAKADNDWHIFQSHLSAVLDVQKEIADAYGFSEHPYDALLDQFDPGMTVAQLDGIFSQIRNGSIELLERVRNSRIKINQDCMDWSLSPEKARPFLKQTLEQIGFDFDSGCMALSMHPFTTKLGNNDIRITTFPLTQKFSQLFFAAVHECGHAIYEQNISSLLLGTGLGKGVSMGIHESQSRFYENLIGRSWEFWEYFYPQLQNTFSSFAGLTQADFWKSINGVKPGLIRTEADELTYNLHIVIRYELEKALLEGALSVDDLPEAWNEKYKNYLGVMPKNDAQGVLQDIHWASGAIGYFPSYTLGNLYSVQFYEKMCTDIPDIKEQIATGHFEPVMRWLGKHIHRHGSVYHPAELLQRSTGEDLQPHHFLKYLEEKYNKIYDI